MKEKLLAGAVLAAAVAGAVIAAEKENPAEKLKMQQLVYQDGKGASLPYCQAVEGKDRPGSYSLLLFLHGAGERGTDNLAQLKHGIPQMMDYIRKHGEKVIVIVPQCPAGKQWVGYPVERKIAYDSGTAVGTDGAGNEAAGCQDQGVRRR